MLWPTEGPSISLHGLKAIEIRGPNKDSQGTACAHYSEFQADPSDTTPE